MTEPKASPDPQDVTELCDAIDLALAELCEGWRTRKVPADAIAIETHARLIRALDRVREAKP